MERLGPEKAFQPLTQEKALCDEAVPFSYGLLRLIPATDEKGRDIVYFVESRQDKTKYTRDSMARVIWYVLHAALESESAQKHGIILLRHPPNFKSSQWDGGVFFETF